MVMNETLDLPARDNGTYFMRLGATNNDYSVAVGGRLQPGGHMDVSVCRGYTGYWCYLDVDKDQTDYKSIAGSLEVTFLCQAANMST